MINHGKLLQIFLEKCNTETIRKHILNEDFHI